MSKAFYGTIMYRNKPECLIGMLQKQNCVVQYLIARETSDDYIWPLIEQKLVVLNKVGLSKDTFSDAMNRVRTQPCSQRHRSDFTC